jgi:hypothetical protein
MNPIPLCLAAGVARVGRAALGLLADDDASMQKTMIQHLYATRKLLDRRARALKVTYDVFIFGLALSLGVFAFVLIRR